MKKRILALAGVLTLVAVLVMPMAAFADNTGTQGASTNKAATIVIQDQLYATTVSTITFPGGAPSAVISTPTNGVGVQVQGFGGATVAKPVVTLLNGSAGVLKIWYTIATFSNSVAASEKYLINAKAAACADVAAVNVAVVFDTLTDSGVQITNGAGNEKDLYLVLTLGALAGKSGTSLITILGETP